VINKFFTDSAEPRTDCTSGGSLVYGLVSAL